MSELAAAQPGITVPRIFSPSGPVGAEERISSVDVARGVALLGILLMNIVAFALPVQAYDDPSIAGGMTGWNLRTWAVVSVLFEGKMRAIFSLLFGAGVILLTAREEREGRGSMADVYYRRVLWLLLFGVVDAYILLWPGDILYGYALCGLALYPFRNAAPKRLILAGLLCLAVLIPLNIMDARKIEKMRTEATAAEQAAAAGQVLTEEQQEARRAWASKLKELKPGPEAVAKNIETMQSGYSEVFWHLAPINRMLQSSGFYRWFWDMLGMMLLGMGLLKLGFFSARLPTRLYATLAVAGYGIGIPVGAYIVQQRIASEFALGESLWLATYTYDVRRVAMTIAHVAVIMLVCKSGTLGWLLSRLAAVGRMAFSNYVSQTLICTLIFYGYGLALFGQLERFQLYGVVAGIWVFQLIVSQIWLRHFRFGPLEWMWRSLTYWERQPMRIRSGSGPGVPTAGVPQAV